MFRTLKTKKITLTLAVAGVFAANMAMGFINPSTSEAARYVASTSMDSQGFEAVQATNIPDNATSNRTLLANGNYIASVDIDAQGFVAVPATNISDNGSKFSKKLLANGNYLVSVDVTKQGFKAVPATNISNVDLIPNLSNN